MSKTTLLIARHGNTFDKGETPRRVGLHTDLDLVEKGQQQARDLGQYLKENALLPDVIFTSTLKRTKQMAQIIVEQHELASEQHVLDIFNEIDYGPDENKTEEEVVARIGQQAINDWDVMAIPPKDWKVDPKKIILDWQGFAREIEDKFTGKTVLVVTSNGIARFAPYLTGDFKSFSRDDILKMATGALSILTKKPKNEFWHTVKWNFRP